MKDVAAPLYRFFLADAQAALREGRTERMLECLGLALDFAPESQRERVLLAAGELVRPAGGAANSGSASVRSSGTVPPLVVEIAAGRAAPRGMGRIAWEEDRVAPSTQVVEYPVPATLAVHTPGFRPRTAARWGWRVAGLVGVLAALTVAGLRFSGVSVGAAESFRGDPAERAAHALEAGDAGGALRILKPLGAEAPAAVWLLRASAYEAVADTPSAVSALGSAAARDADGGYWALEAGDRLGRLGAIAPAADAYLYAVTPLRTNAELDRIARMQERAGHPDRARRVRQH